MLNIEGYSPRSGWPGSLIEIKGSGFSTNRDSNEVRIGEEAALIIDASEQRLLILAGERTKGGELTVKVGTATAIGKEFKLEPYPDSTDFLSGGAPRFFHAAVPGTPKTNVQDQPVLVIFAVTSSGITTFKSRDELIAEIDKAREWWRSASYGSTTWKMAYSEFVELPPKRGYYFWEQEDIDRGRERLLAMSARPVVRQAATLFRGASNGIVPIGHPDPLHWSFNFGVAADGTQTLGMRLKGTRLYLTTTGGGLFIYDVANPTAPVQLGSVSLGSFPVFAVDILGDYAIVAMGRYGLGSVDVSNPSAPAIVSGASTSKTSELRNAVRVSGDIIYSNGGTLLRVSRIAPNGQFMGAGSDHPPLQMDIKGWITDIAIEGSLCAVTTDDGGFRLYQLTQGLPIARGKFVGVPRSRSVELVNGRAYLAAYDEGLVILDCTDPDAPQLLWRTPTELPVYGLNVNGNEVVVSTGDSVLISIDVSNVAPPAIVGDQPTSGFEPSLSDARAALSTAVDHLGQVRSRERLMIDVLRGYFATPGASPSIDDFKGVVVLIDGPARATAWTSSAAEIRDGGDAIPLNEAKGFTYIQYNDDWTVLAHELCHWLGVGDTYQEAYADGSVLLGSAAEWCLSGSSARGCLFSGHWMHDTLHWYQFDPGQPTSNVVEFAWHPTEMRDERLELVAHGENQEPATSDRHHLIKLIVSTGQAYYIETRQAKPANSGGQPLPFDQILPLDPSEPGRVVVTRINAQNSPANTYERDVQLAGALAVGEAFVDAARNLTITVEAQTASDPLAFRIHLEWNTPIAGDPNGTFDLAITPWSQQTWETPDIWVDSPRNNAGATAIYEFHEPGKPNSPILNGDRPWVKRVNTIHARIRNTGPQAVDEAYVSCYVTTPPGIGDNGQWQLIETRTVEGIPGHGETIVVFDWTPSGSGHTCISIAIQPKIGEINTKNNRAQENVSAFDSGSASSHQPIMLEAEVRSPYSIWKKVDLLVQDLPAGWHAVVDQAWVWLGPKAARPMRAVIWSDIGTPAGLRRKIDPLALPRVEGWTDRFDQYQPIGGILAPVRAVKKVRLALRPAVREGRIDMSGVIQPAIAGVGIVVEATDAGGRTVSSFGTTDAQGWFNAMLGGARQQLKSGRFVVRASTVAGSDAAEAESDPIELDVP